ncbi:interferon gamma receptor 1 [Cebidichthys violaceus]|uniref:interferon gamma receptor 1 n=1 Tax=Cebidichthys violaceus TaxID=271503 RepID=UPI0035C957D7
MLLGVAFTVLLLLIGGVSAVPSPKNVKLSCQNLKVSVSWEYSEQTPETSFRVDVGGSAGSLVIDTTEHQYDLSPFIWASEEHYMGFHHVTVTAEEGGNQSKPIQSQTFTFNFLKTADINCKLDFPTVDLVENESGATVSVMNPFSFTELEKAVKSDSSTFKFTVTTSSGKTDGACTAQDKVCKLDILFPEGAEKCVKTLKGTLFDGIEVSQVQFNETGPICVSKPTGVDVQMLAILLCAFSIVAAVIIVAICVVKAWRLTASPKPPTSLRPNHNEGALRYTPVCPTYISPVTVAGNNPLVSSEEEEEEDHLRDSSVNYQPSARSYAEGGLLSEGEDSADDSEKTEVVSMDLEEEEEEEEVLAYDRPQTLQLDMGDGDMVTGYTER